MKYFLLTFLLFGCTSTEDDREVICRLQAECDNCTIIHECTGTREEELIELKG